jgi:hypothetical protein
MIVVLEHSTNMTEVPQLHSTDKCTDLQHPIDMIGVPQQKKTYPHTKHCIGYSLYIYFIVVLMVASN